LKGTKPGKDKKNCDKKKKDDFGQRREKGGRRYLCAWGEGGEGILREGMFRRKDHKKSKKSGAQGELPQ